MLRQGLQIFSWFPHRLLTGATSPPLSERDPIRAPPASTSRPSYDAFVKGPSDSNCPKKIAFDIMCFFFSWKGIYILNPFIKVNISKPQQWLTKLTWNWQFWHCHLWKKGDKSFIFILWNIGRTWNGHNSVSFNLILKIQNSTARCVKDVSEYVRHMCLAFILQ